jgi:hypothetical protein
MKKHMKKRIISIQQIIKHLSRKKRKCDSLDITTTENKQKNGYY